MSTVEPSAAGAPGPPAPSRRRWFVTAACTVGGAVLFAYVVRRTGAGEIAESIRRVGLGLVTILALQGVRFALRTECWRLCMPPDVQLSFGRAFSAFLAGDAIGSVTPLGLLASEPTKVFLTRHDLATRDSVASLAVENVIYALSVGAMVALGLVVVLATVPLPLWWQWGIVGALAGGGAAAAWLRYRMRRPSGNGSTPRPRWREVLTDLRMAVVGFSDAHRRRLWRAFALDTGFHALAVLEVFLTLRWLMGDQSPTMAQAIVFEALNRIATVAFKFVPFRIGVDEAIAGAAAPMLAVNPAAAVALAVVRKVRNLVWSGVGLAIIAVHPAKADRGIDRPGIAPARRL